MSDSSSNGPPPSNPVLSAYLSFVQNTPLVTRYIITTITLSWFASFFADPSYALSNIPFFTIYKFELYRLVTSPLLCTGILNLLFAWFGFVEHGKRLEFSLGSGAFAVLLLTLGLSTNVIFCVLAVTVHVGTGSDMLLHASSGSIWIVLLALIAVECSNAPPETKRKLFVVEVPTLYYPLAILALFTLLGGLQVPYFLSVGIGYAYGRGYLNRFKIASSRINGWEGNDGCLSNFTRRQGWVVGHSATGSGAWSDVGGGGGGGSGSGGGWQPTSFLRGQPTDGGGGGGGSGSGSGGAGGTVANPPDGGWSAPGAVKKPSFPKAGGKSLGGSGGGGGRGGSSDSARRAAALAAAERRSAGGASAGAGNEEDNV